MPNSTILRFVDPHEYQRSVRAADMKVFVTAPGEYRAELTRIDLHRLWMQRSRVSLPHITHSAVNKARSVTFFLTHARQTPMHHSGVELLPGDMMFDSPGAEHYHRSSAECQWGAMSLTPAGSRRRRASPCRERSNGSSSNAPDPATASSDVTPVAFARSSRSPCLRSP